MAGPIQIGCLNSAPHDDNITDHVLHFFGCLEFSDRASFFESIKSEEERETVKRDCEQRLRHVHFLRFQLTQDPDSEHLVNNIRQSSYVWRNSDDYQSNINKVREWRLKEGKRSAPEPDIDFNFDDGRYERYNVRKDVSVQILQFKGGIPRDLPDPRVVGHFPNQTTTIERLLPGDESQDPDSGLLLKDPDLETIKYFHIPSNNMEWAQDAIARYFGESLPGNPRTQQGADSATAHILRESHWRSRFDEEDLKPTSRFMRPFCDSVSTSSAWESVPKNVVLFMPYLHWETSRQLGHFARKIDDMASSQREHIYEQESNERKQRIQARESLTRRRRRWSFDFSRYRPPMGNPKRILTMHGLLEELGMRFENPYGLEIDDNGRVKIRNPLGQYLIDAARLFEGMVNYRDKKLLESSLFTDAPLHPRRTLDQGYYNTLSSARGKGRSQVVYRATTPDPLSYHRYNSRLREWENHENIIPELGSCRQCLDNIRKVSRVVMVDQLWMWILDEKVVITCFPDRYGKTGHDPSGVSESVRTRLNQGHTVGTVFEIALAILNETTEAIFDRTKNSAGQPKVLDAFSNAIMKVRQKQTIDFERLWHWINIARRINRRQAAPDLPNWDLRAEGEIEIEIQDIVEELEIILSIYKSQLEVITRFVRQVSEILEPDKISRTHKKLAQADIFKSGGANLLLKVNERIDYLEKLLRSALDAASTVKDLSQLRQQQDSIIQAWQSVRLSSEAIDQSKTIMVFTIVTIIFAPLSFMSSIFGMNAAEFADNQITLRQQFTYIFPVSLAVFLVALVATSSRARAVILLPWRWVMSFYRFRYRYRF
ncbi:hypothetical protein F5Y04DRAFT_241086 [Hypomontagnella monticulosa]|nr:hypothetical protein F5Y04DRAFT_241086 [Hypomontagnella monticulosa]